MKHDSIWDIETADGNFSEVIFSKLQDEQLQYTVLPIMFQAINTIEDEILSLDQFDEEYEIYNAFYGINFHDIEVTDALQILQLILPFVKEIYGT